MNIKNLSTKLIATSILLVGAVAIAPKAMAQSVDVDFGVNITKSCFFGPVISGVLQESVSDLTTLTPGSVTLSCNTSTATLNIKAPTQAGANPVAATSITFSGTVTPSALGESATTITNATTDQTGINLGIGNNPISLTLVADLPSAPIPAGQYTYTIALTANPN